MTVKTAFPREGRTHCENKRAVGRLAIQRAVPELGKELPPPASCSEKFISCIKNVPQSKESYCHTTH